MLLFVDPSQIYTNQSGATISIAARCAACHLYTSVKLAPAVVTAVHRQVSEYLSQESSEIIAAGSRREFRTPFDNRIFRIDADLKRTSVRDGDGKMLDCYHPVYDRRHYLPNLIDTTIEAITRRVVAALKTLRLPPETVAECFAHTESLAAKQAWSSAAEGIVALDKYVEAGTFRRAGDDYRVYIEKEALVTRIAKHLTLKFQSKIQKVSRIVYFRRARFIREFVPREVISAAMSGNGFRLNFEDLGIVWRNLAHVREIRDKAPALLYMYLHHLDRLENFFDRSYDEKSDEFYGANAMRAARQMRETLAEKGMAGLREKVFPAAVSTVAAGEPPRNEFRTTTWNVCQLSKRLWKTLVKLPSSRWTQMIYERCYGDTKKFTDILSLLAGAEKKPKLSRLQWYLKLIYDSRELSDTEKIWIYRAVLKQPARLRLNAAEFSRQLLRIRDFVQFTHPKPDSNQEKSGWTWLAAASDVWHKTTLRDDFEGADYSWAAPVRSFAAGNFLGVTLTSAQALARESVLMSHCVRNYATLASQGKSTLFHLIRFTNEKTRAEKQLILDELTAAADWRGVYDLLESITTKNQATAELADQCLTENRRQPRRHNFKVTQIKGFADRNAAEFASFAETLKNHFAGEYNRLKDAPGTEFAAQVKTWTEERETAPVIRDTDDIPF